MRLHLCMCVCVCVCVSVAPSSSNSMILLIAIIFSLVAVCALILGCYLRQRKLQQRAGLRQNKLLGNEIALRDGEISEAGGGGAVQLSGKGGSQRNSKS